MTAVATSPFLDLRALAALGNMRFATRQRIDGGYTGRHASRQQGGSGEFADYREYADGEDLRRLDWKVLARTGRAYLRLYQEETNLRCMLALDASGSMQFGGQPAPIARRWLDRLPGRHGITGETSAKDRDVDRGGSKLAYAQYLSTALSHVISQGRDQVGLAVLADSLREFVPTGSTGSHVTRIQGLIAELTTTPSLKLAASLQALFQRVAQRGVLLLISDFLLDDLEATFAALRLFRHRQWEVITLHLIHRDEERLPEGTAYRFQGMENEGEFSCSPGEIREQYESLFRHHCGTVRTLALTSGCDYRRVSTAVSYLQTLGSFLVERSG